MSANIVSVDEESLRKDIENLVRKTVEETLNALLDEEASELVGAGRYERTAGREAYRSGHYARKLVTGAGEVELNVPSCAARPSRRPSSSATAGARPRSRRPSSRCTSRASRPGGSGGAAGAFG